MAHIYKWQVRKLYQLKTQPHETTWIKKQSIYTDVGTYFPHVKLYYILTYQLVIFQTFRQKIIVIISLKILQIL